MTFHIFYATKHLPARNNLPAWANGTKTWPQYLVLAIACVSLLLCLVVFWNYWRGGHARAEKVAVYYTLFAVGYFIFSTIMWGVAAGVLQGTKSNSNNKDMWGWSCVDNKRRELFKEEVDYALVCRLQVRSSHQLPKQQLTKTELVSRLLHHRDRPREHNNHPLRRRLLPLLLQTASPQVYGHPRPRTLRSLPRTATLTIRAQYTRFRTHVPQLLLLR